MLGRALVDLPVHAERLVVVDLEPVHADVARAGDRIAREDHRQRDVAAAVTRPAAEHGQGGQRRVIGLGHLLARRRAHALGAGLHHVEEGAELAQLVEDRAGHAQVDQLGHARGELVEMAHAERGGHAIGRAEGVDEHRHLGALHVLEEQRQVAAARALGHAVGDLGDLQIARDRRAHALEGALFLEVGDELAEVGERHGGPAIRDSRASRASPRRSGRPGSWRCAPPRSASP
jgi:hypothetical protein